MTGDDVRTAFEQMLPQDEIDRLCQEYGVIERQRTLPLGMLVRALVMAAGTPGGAYQADGLRSSLECEVPRVARAAFYRWFDAPSGTIHDGAGRPRPGLCPSAAD